MKISMKLLYSCVINFCNAIYLIQVSSFDLASALKVVDFMSQSSNSIDLLVIYNVWVIFEKYDNNKKDNCVATDINCALLAS